MASDAWARAGPVFTIGHSTRTLEELVEPLRAAGVRVLADIRTVPRSRHNPQFDRESLERSLPAHGIRYEHVAKLGGLRRARKDSPNAGWRNASFRGYADYMQTPEFEAGLSEVRALARAGSVALMCAEAVPWRCHRSLVADALTARGATVLEITGTGAPRPHRITKFAKVEGTRVTYPAAGTERPLSTEAPFHLEATVRVLQRRPSNPVDVLADGRYLRLFPTPHGFVLVSVIERGSIDAPDVRLEILSGDPPADTLAAIERRLRASLGLDVAPAPLQAAAERVRALRPTARALRGMRPPRFTDLFELFLNVIPYQQLSLDAGAAILSRLVRRFGEHAVHDGRRFDSFPAAVTIADAHLRSLAACGLSRPKADSLRRIARAIASGELTEGAIERLDTPAALRMLNELPGIGPWSAALVMLRGFGRLEVFPPGDSGAQRGLEALLRSKNRAALGRAIERFGEYRGYLYFCGLGAALLKKGLIEPAP